MLVPEQPISQLNSVKFNLRQMINRAAMLRSSQNGLCQLPPPLSSQSSAPDQWIIPLWRPILTIWLVIVNANNYCYGYYRHLMMASVSLCAYFWFICLLKRPTRRLQHGRAFVFMSPLWDQPKEHLLSNVDLSFTRTYRFRANNFLVCHREILSIFALIQISFPKQCSLSL